MALASRKGAGWCALLGCGAVPCRSTCHDRISTGSVTCMVQTTGLPMFCSLPVCHLQGRRCPTNCLSCRPSWRCLQCRSGYRLALDGLSVSGLLAVLLAACPHGWLAGRPLYMCSCSTRWGHNVAPLL